MTPDPPAADPTLIIARAIRDADKRYFFEDYNLQARAVITALHRHGLIILPREPSSAMIEAGRKSIVYGAQRQGDLLLTLWRTMIKAATDW